MVEDKKEEHVHEAEGNQTLYYIAGALVVIAIAAGAYFLRPKPTTETTSPTSIPAAQQQVASTGQISQLACEQQYYNPVIGFPKYYLSVAGVDVDPAKSVECTFTVSVAGQVVATESASSSVDPVADRGGGTYRCTTEAVKLEKTVPTKVDIEITDDLEAVVGCSRTFSFP